MRLDALEHFCSPCTGSQRRTELLRVKSYGDSPVIKGFVLEAGEHEVHVLPTHEENH